MRPEDRVADAELARLPYVDGVLSAQQVADTARAIAAAAGISDVRAQQLPADKAAALGRPWSQPYASGSTPSTSGTSPTATMLGCMRR